MCSSTSLRSMLPCASCPTSRSRLISAAPLSRYARRWRISRSTTSSRSSTARCRPTASIRKSCEGDAMARFLIAVTDSPFPSLDPAKAALARVDFDLRMAKSPSADDILAVAHDADAVLVTYAKLPGELLRQLTRCKAIGRFGLGVDNIDIPAAAALGISVNYVPDYCMQEVSDHPMALLLSLCRTAPLSNNLLHPGPCASQPTLR